MAQNIVWVSQPVNAYRATFYIPDKYENLQPIANGTFGIVVSAHDRSANRNVAIKKIARINYPDFIKRTYREVKTIKYVNHDNLVRVFEVFTDATSADRFKDLYIVTELFDTNLRRVLQTQDLKDDQQRLCTYQLCCALKYLHSCGIMHRDLKPENVCLNVDNTVKLIDFGLARTEDPQSNLTGYVVTRWYRAPELLVKDPHYTTKIDMWSLGCIVAELFTNVALFPGQNSRNQLEVIVQRIGFPEKESEDTFYKDAVSVFNEIRKSGIEIGQLGNNFNSTIDPNALDFIRKLLDWNPERRSTAAIALEHPYLAKLHDPTDEPEGLPLEDLYMDCNFTMDDWKTVMFESVDYHRMTIGDQN